MRRFDERKTTTNNAVYRKVYLFSILKCPICGPNKGCNSYSKYKSYCWKDQNKKKKQWM